jgi:hypothetical protein
MTRGTGRPTGNRTPGRIVSGSVLLVLAGGWLLLGPRDGSAQSLRYSGSLQYATGSYVFDARSHSFYLTSGLGLDVGRFDVSASVPLVLQNGGVVTTAGDRLLPTGGEGHGVVSHRRSGDRIRTHTGGGMGSGDGLPQPDSSVGFSESYRFRIGDPYLRGGWELLRDRRVLRSVRLGAGVKVPATDLDSGVGTGEWDHTVGASVMVAAGRVLLSGDVAYWWYGDLPELELRDGLSYGVAGAGPFLDGRGILMLSLAGAERLAPNMEAPLSLGAAVGYRLGERWSLNGGISVGMTESTSDLSVYVGWSRPLTPTS